MPHCKYNQRFLRSFRIVVSIILTGCWSFNAQSLEDAPNNVEAQSYIRPAAYENLGSSIAPVVGYDPIYRFVYGGAYFYNGESLSYGIDFNLNFRKVYQAHLHLAHEFASDWEYQLHSGITKGFDPYYGEGGETSISDFERLWGVNSRSKLLILYHLDTAFSFGIFSEARFRNEAPVEGEPFSRRFPNETEVGMGVLIAIDTRDNKQSPRNGFNFETTATYVPRKLSPEPVTDNFAQISGSFIVYKEILEAVIPNVIAAYSLSGGYTIAGRPSYMYEYRLGGPTALRGYNVNRFRGIKFYLQQTELRFPIWKAIGGAGFVGFGDATLSKFTNAKLAYGIGVRIGLPPDWVNKIRIDVGFGRDESGIFAEFGQTF